MFAHLNEAAAALFTDQRNWVCNLANCASLLWHAYEHLAAEGGGKPKNWTGFYVRDARAAPAALILGPFMGKVACQTIPFGRGVCGTAAQEARTVVVPDVEAFPGHIACDGGTRSEIVVPIVDGQGVVVAIIDVDCLETDGFDEADREGLEELARLVGKACDW